LTWTVTNAGSGVTAESAWSDRIVMSLDGTFDSNDIVLASIPHTGALAPGAIYTNNATVTLPIGLSGDFKFLVVTDAQFQVYEHALDGNNTGHTTSATHINLTPPPDLEASLISVPSSAIAGHTLPISYRITNAGSSITPNTSWTDRIYLSADASLSSDDIKLADLIHYGALDASQSYDVSTNLTLPNTLSGNYYVIVQ